MALFSRWKLRARNPGPLTPRLLLKGHTRGCNDPRTYFWCSSQSGLKKPSAKRKEPIEGMKYSVKTAGPCSPPHQEHLEPGCCHQHVLCTHTTQRDCWACSAAIRNLGTQTPKKLSRATMEDKDLILIWIRAGFGAEIHGEACGPTGKHSIKYPPIDFLRED